MLNKIQAVVFVLFACLSVNVVSAQSMRVDFNCLNGGREVSFPTDDHTIQRNSYIPKDISGYSKDSAVNAIQESDPQDPKDPSDDVTICYECSSNGDYVRREDTDGDGDCSTDKKKKKKKRTATNDNA